MARLRLANHTTDFFVPMTGRSASLDPGPLFSPPASARHVPYTLTAPELCRLLDEAEHRADAASYWLRYTALPELDPSVVALSDQLTDPAQSPYERVRAVLGLFTDPANGFMTGAAIPVDGGLTAI